MPQTQKEIKDRYRTKPGIREAERAYTRSYMADEYNTSEGKTKILERNRVWREKNPSKVKASKIKDQLWKKYRLTVEQYEEMLRRQNHRCAICGLEDWETNSRGQRLAVDHDHETGRIRALLCTSCNVMIGHAKEDQTILTKGIEYLEKWKV